MPHPYKRIMPFHAESNFPRVAVEELLLNAQPMHCVDQLFVPLGELHIVDGYVLRVLLGVPWLKHIFHAPLVF
jgi:hypothetical protein